jgi:hypothetical protein
MRNPILVSACEASTLYLYMIELKCWSSLLLSNHGNIVSPCRWPVVSCWPKIVRNMVMMNKSYYKSQSFFPGQYRILFFFSRSRRTIHSRLACQSTQTYCTPAAVNNNRVAPSKAQLPNPKKTLNQTRTVGIWLLTLLLHCKYLNIPLHTMQLYQASASILSRSH